jgi:hypothetical protein
MIRVTGKIIKFLYWLIFVVILLAAPVAVAGPRCDPEAARHVYNPERLTVVRPCVEVTGKVVDATHGKRRDGVRHEADGDPHGWLSLDTGHASELLNDGNRKFEEGNLVFEIPCLFPVTQEDAKAACTGYRSKVVLPPVGSRVRMTGILVREKNHGRWMELHPVSKIEILGGPGEPARR